MFEIDCRDVSTHGVVERQLLGVDSLGSLVLALEYRLLDRLRGIAASREFARLKHPSDDVGLHVLDGPSIFSTNRPS